MYRNNYLITKQLARATPIRQNQVESERRIDGDSWRAKLSKEGSELIESMLAESVYLIPTRGSSRFLSSLSGVPRWQRPFLVDEIRGPIPYYRGLSTSFRGFNYATAVSGGSNGSLPFIAFTAVSRVSCALYTLSPGVHLKQR